MKAQQDIAEKAAEQQDIAEKAAEQQDGGMLGEIVRYLIVGGLTTVVSLSVYYGCVLTFLDPENPLQLQAANIISWIAAVTFAFFANRIFVFRSRGAGVLREAGAFYLARVGTLLMDMCIMDTHSLGLPGTSASAHSVSGRKALRIRKMIALCRLKSR